MRIEDSLRISHPPAGAAREPADRKRAGRQDSVPSSESDAISDGIVGYSKERVERAAEKLTDAARLFEFKIHFKVHEDTRRIIVQVIDEESGDIINEVPPEKILDIVAEIWRLVGLLVDEKV